MDRGQFGEQDGFVLGLVLIILAVVMALLLGYAGLSSIELATTRSERTSVRGYYAAEAGLNCRADQMRSIFVGGGLPSGTAPTTGSPAPCQGANLGSGDLACASYAIGDQAVQSYVTVSSPGGQPIVIPRGEAFANLYATEHRHVIHSDAYGPTGNLEASLELRVGSRSVPLFQFAAFYAKDLEILPAAAMVLGGPVHSSGDLYLGSGSTLDIGRPVTVVGDLYRGRKDADTCLAGAVRVSDPDTLTEIPTCSSGRAQIMQADVVAWKGMIDVDVAAPSAPGLEILEPVLGHPYWTDAHLRVVLDVNGAPLIEVRDPDGTTDVVKTALLAGCGAMTPSLTLYDNREGTLMQLLDFNVPALLTCADLGLILGINLVATPKTELVIHLGIDGPDSATLNNYGVRLINGSELTSILPAGPTDLLGLTVASDQAVYVWGDFNVINKKPAAILGDSINLLSNSWVDPVSLLALSLRVPTATTINAAVMAGTDSTGGLEGSAGQDGGAYNGGLENFFRLHEDWAGAVTLTYRGSFVSLGAPRHVDGAWTYGAPDYTAPNRNWSFDTDFKDPSRLPPLSPSLSYLRRHQRVSRFDL